MTFAGVAQQPEHRGSRPEVGGKNPPPRSNVLLFPRSAPPSTQPLLVAFVAALAGIAIVVLALAAYAAGIVLRGLP